MKEKKREDIVAAARQVFLLHGYSRVTMGEIAKASGMSRPALYLVFSRKEDIFTAVMTNAFASMLADVRSGLSDCSSIENKLIFALDVWCVQPYELIQSYPEAKDLLESSYKFATEVTTQAFDEFCSVIAELLNPLVQKKKNSDLTAVQLAQIIVKAIPGFKASAKDAIEVRFLIKALIKVVLQSLGEH